MTGIGMSAAVCVRSALDLILGQCATGSWKRAMRQGRWIEYWLMD